MRQPFTLTPPHWNAFLLAFPAFTASSALARFCPSSLTFHTRNCARCRRGLRVGIHTLRGSVSSEAIAKKSPILGTKYTVDQIATTKCQWNSNWWAVNMSHPVGTVPDGLDALQLRFWMRTFAPA